MYFKKTLIIPLISIFFKYNFAFNCLPCTCETENSAISASCSYITSKINENKKLNRIPISIQSFSSKEEIGELDFEGQNFEKLNDDLSSFSNVERIVFSHNLINHLHPDSLKNLTLLKTLNLDNNQITEIPLDFFQKNHKIEHIFLHNNKITSLAKNVFANLPNLAEVHLNQNYIERIEDNCFLNVPSLKTLDLSSNNLTTLSLNFTDHWDTLVFVYFDKNPWVCDIHLCDLINTSLEKKWSHGRVPECFHSNGMKTNRNWEDLQILEPLKILEFQSPVDVNQTVVLTCQIYICSFPSMFWDFNGTNLVNSTHCIDGHKHTLTNVFNGIEKDNEGSYTCFINNCSFCANSSRYLIVNDVDLNVETSTWEEEQHTLRFDAPDLKQFDAPKVKKPDICWNCIICLLIGKLIGIVIGFFIGLFIGFLIIIFILPNICCCCPGIYKTKCFKWFTNKLKSVVEKFEENTTSEENLSNEGNPSNDFSNDFEMEQLNAQKT